VVVVTVGGVCAERAAFASATRLATYWRASAIDASS
jgi:hypothetical protein